MKTSISILIIVAGSLLVFQLSCSTSGHSGKLIGGAAGAGLGALIGGDDHRLEGALIGAGAGVLAGALYDHWQNVEAKESAEEMVLTPEELEKRRRVEHPDQPVYRQPTLAIVQDDSALVPSQTRPNQEVTCTVTYDTMGSINNRMHVCRKDTLKTIENGQEVAIMDIYDRCDLAGLGRQRHTIAFEVPPGAQSDAPYIVETTLAIIEGQDKIIDTKVRRFPFTVMPS